MSHSLFSNNFDYSKQKGIQQLVFDINKQPVMAVLMRNVYLCMHNTITSPRTSENSCQPVYAFLSIYNDFLLFAPGCDIWISHNMDFKKIISLVTVKYCSKDKCLQNTEYVSLNCQKDFCFKCHKEHSTSLDTKHHSITLYRNKGSHFPNKNETCSIHLDSIYQKYCEFCNIPICDKCKGYRKHRFSFIMARLRGFNICNVHWNDFSF